MPATARNVVPDQEDILLAKEASRLLAKLRDGDEPVELEMRRNGDSLSLKLPAPVVRVLLDALVGLSDGKPVTVVSQDTVLGTVQAAKFLGMSRTHLTKLIDSGEIKHHMVGSHRKMMFTDLIEYKTNDDEYRLRKAAEADKIAEELGLM
ncbi:excisionase family DNA-binding protein [Hwanghaeella sp.]|uniref:excisionase family DNA-binding protein n=1 Tax=Hwanghaeella sp. TaxID=2605943 RepID=UPI003CCC451C